ncbi:hypothetical protein ABT366_39120, partial [Streptomyces lydicus]
TVPADPKAPVSCRTTSVSDCRMTIRSAGVPRRALLGAAAVTLVAAVWAARREDGLDQLSSVVNVGALTAFALLHASVIGWFGIRKGGGAPGPLRHVVVSLLGLAVVVAVIVAASPTAQVVGGVWLTVGLVVLAVQYRRRARAGGGAAGAGD